MRRSRKYDEALTLLQVAEQIGETAPTAKALQQRVKRMLRELERKAGRGFLFSEKGKLKFTRYGLSRLLAHRRNEEQERSDDVAQIIDELSILRRRQNGLAASGRRLAKEVAELKSLVKLGTSGNVLERGPVREG